MVMSGMLEGGIALFIAIVAAAVVVGQMKESAKANKDAIEEIKKMFEKSQEENKELLRQNMQDVKDMLDAQKDDQNAAMSKEIAHVRENLTLTISEIRDDIRRLELSQNENAKLREELILLRSSVKSLHKRLDVEIPDSIKGYED